MIDVKELRIGNYLTSKTWGGYHKVQGIEQISENEYQIKINGIVFTVRDDIYCELEPIPLTEELLKGWKSIYTTDPQELDAELEYSFNDFFLYTKDKKKFIFATYNETIEVKYLHLLQNLFFDIKNTNLEIKL